MQYFGAVSRLAMIAVLALAASGRAATDQAVNILLNGGAEQVTDDGQLPLYWYPAVRPAEGLELWRDREFARSGQGCFAIANEHVYPQPAANNWAQKLRYIPIGRTVRLSGYIRTQDAEAANLCVQCWGPDELQLVGFSSTPRFRRTHGWTFAQAPDVVVPPSTTKLVVRAALTGKGKAYFDDLSLQIVGEPLFEEDGLIKQVKGRIVDTLPITKDCMILASLPRWDNGNVDNIAVANSEGGVRTLLTWQEPTPQEVAQSKLQFLLAMYVREAKHSGKAVPVQMHAVLANWKEQTSWEQRPAFARKPAARFEITAAKGWKIFDVTSFVREGVEARRPNHGLVLRFADENSSVGDSTYASYGFVSREGIGPWENRRPVLLVVDPTQSPGKPAVTVERVKLPMRLSSQMLLNYLEYLASLPDVPIESVPGAGTAYFEASQRALNAPTVFTGALPSDPKKRFVAMKALEIPPHEYFIQRYPLTPEGLQEMSVLALIYASAERLPDAMRLSAAAVKLGKNSELACILEINYASLETESGDLDAAEKRLRRVMGQSIPASASDRRATDIAFVAPLQLAELLKKRKRPEEVDRVLTELVNQATRWGKVHPEQKQIACSFALAAYKMKIDALLDQHTESSVSAARKLAKECEERMPDCRSDRVQGVTGREELEGYIESSLHGTMTGMPHIAPIPSSPPPGGRSAKTPAKSSQ
jgi:hypothetical protein